MSNEVRVRYAPSPTGHLHIGNARTALFNYLYARNAGGKVVIRIEDTDEKRNVEGGEQSQLNYLKWLGIDWDESPEKGGEYGPYRQMERLDIYKKYVDDLLERGLAYKCYMTAEELEAEREAQMARGEAPKYSGAHRDLTDEQIAEFEAEGRQPSIRIRVPENHTYTFNDIVRGDITFESSDFGDWVIVKQNGTPTYNFAVAVDDYMMKITHVLRGEEHISNTPKQMMVYEAFGWEPPKFGHMTLILNEERKKLSKRDEHILQFIEQYKNLGYLPEALFNFITLLGWSPVGEEEIFTQEKLVEIFDADRLSTSPAVFDPAKLKWMNNQYIKASDLDTVVDLALPHLIEAGRFSEEMNEEERQGARELISLYQEQLSYGAEIVELTELFFKQEIQYDDAAMEVLEGEQVPEVLETFKKNLQDLNEFTPENIKKQIKAVQKETGHKGKKLFMPVRVATTGQTHGPELPNAIHLLGVETVVVRLEDVLRKLQA
ncbi:glutamyl-tRNA synthetase /glutamate--tRNA(Gln) ligase [Halobacillus karajensis]|uniref:Glutamate--tRNA ligase n=1 Tax=Halobacillus karajensis TaxID=195088 RepID=A0A024P9J0_9BACI|nr:glutamate--tRNA ligase [Halobacillus karajensis]CDQ21661.1 Glutamate--tRNA ligase [Halobacillus karajensis]CDQ25739.1 Glutamate--tRNA ligase [Halobacillus karajensis]CDQ29591.1 Glutamate--tRNA ligase [Halobacillus karajensis]SEI11020.1 glutamyl-tRNA synthetase /glutamate--tRNA(Gln) ligase [Halobacillus karajensis]